MTTNIMNLFRAIIRVCRQDAKKMRGFDSGDGAIRLCYLPQPASSEDADRFEVVARITPTGNYVLNRNLTDGQVDTYAMSAMKVATCLRLYEKFECRKSDVIDNDEAHGYAPYRGALLYELEANGKLFGLVVVSVSGASQEEDELVAAEAERAIFDWCHRYSNARARLTFTSPPV